MCGIIGYIGKKNSIPIIIEGLKNLEYRGYDSSGIAYLKDNKVSIVKEEGKISKLESILPKGISNIAIGHTRWATHGAPNKINAHPHKVGKITLVHNGIIENYQELKKFLMEKGYTFKSDTDTEIVAGIIDYYYALDEDIHVTLSHLKDIVKGSYALAILVDGIDKIYAVKYKSPLIIGITKDGYMLASDIPAILSETNKYIILEDNDICEISDTLNIFNNYKKIKREELEYLDSYDSALKNGYAHYMLKEINEEPFLVDRLVGLLDKEKTINLKKYSNIEIVACGSAYHAGLVGKYLIEKYLNIKTDVYIASEYRYSKMFYNKKTLFISVSQSGETADTIASLNLAKEHGIHTLGIVNTVKSTIARLSDEVLYINAGIECAVATTKAYSLQCLMFAILVNKCLKKKYNLNNISKHMESLLTFDYKKIANKLYKKEDIFFIGRQIDYALTMEASLKIKEISYIHSECYAAGELKHGTISLIEKDTPVISIITDNNILDKTISNLKEVKARGAYVLIVSSINLDKYDDLYDDVIYIDKINDLVEPILAILPLQLLAYNVALLRGCDIDKPRNLAKSVTVE